MHPLEETTQILELEKLRQAVLERKLKHLRLQLEACERNKLGSARWSSKNFGKNYGKTELKEVERQIPSSNEAKTEMPSAYKSPARSVETGGITNPPDAVQSKESEKF